MQEPVAVEFTDQCNRQVISIKHKLKEKKFETPANIVQCVFLGISKTANGKILLFILEETCR